MARVEATRLGLDIRFVVTNVERGGSPDWIYNSLYYARGQAENLIKLHKIATCPAGQTSESWIPDTNCGHDNVRIRFSLTRCKACPLKARCTRSNRRILAPRRRQEHEALVAARKAAKDPAFIAERKRHAGIEGTLSKAVRTNGLRRSRYIGAAKTQLQQVLTATAINLGRLPTGLQGTSSHRPENPPSSASWQRLLEPAHSQQYPIRGNLKGCALACGRQLSTNGLRVGRC